ncbi:MAG: MCE family protein [Rhodococcus sp.]|uniref:MCE family protein n=1 Tax=Rhodococcus sp. TaxID=1831 RepID=UPI00169FC3B6|nr:MCE family protein [Rhodococcus sp. (in: high G+C Gram-positive bacteria)]NLV78631.1 MCE family protein [Rhodococcus sp. (in: high G+C Gram-positive bacteria)]
MKLKRSQSAALAGYCVVGAVCGILVHNTLAVPVRGSTDDYVLEFTDVEGLNAGNPVTLSGVRVGRVDSVEVVDAEGGTTLARVTVEIERDRVLTTDVEAAVRYGDMLGARYVALTLPEPYVDAPGGPQILDPGGTVPVAQTTPPVDLTALMNGFRPLFESLPPDEVDVLARNIVDTFNGRGDAVARFLDRVAVLSTQLGDREGILGDVVTDMNRLLGTIEGRHDRLGALVDGLSVLGDTVVGDGSRLAAFLDSGSSTVAELADAMVTSDGAFTRTLENLSSVTGSWNADTAEFDGLVARLPEFADRINRTGQYGGFVSLYLCNFTLKAGDAEVNIFGPTHSPVCS